jgi:microcystin-dependent protein
MSLLFIPKQYKDGQILFKSALDAIVNSLLAFFNNQNLSGGNFQGGGIESSNLGPNAQVAPLAAIMEWPLTIAPNANWLICYGQAISRTTYAGLFGVIGTTYGVGDGSTTFNLPDLRGYTLAGFSLAPSPLTIVDSTVLGAAGGNQQIGNHTHGIGSLSVVSNVDSGHSHTMPPDTHGHTELMAPVQDNGGTVVGNGNSFANNGTTGTVNPFTGSSGFAEVTSSVLPATANYNVTSFNHHTHTLVGQTDTTGTGITGSTQPFQIIYFLMRAL